MELKTRPVFPLFEETLNYLDIGVVGKILNIVRNKNKFIFHIALDKCLNINDYEIDQALLDEHIPLSNVQPGSLLACIHPQTKKWMRCYVVSITTYRQAYVALCDTGEMTVTKKLKDVPEKFKSIPVLTFQAEVRCICPHEKLRHLVENFKEYVATFKSLRNKPKGEILKNMSLTYKSSSTIDFIIKTWDPLSCMNISDTNFNSMMFKNGSAVVIAKVENYDWRHIFVRSVDKFVNVCKELQNFCENVSNIKKNPAVGEIVGVKCVDKFYRGKIVDVLDTISYLLYLIDSGYVITASMDCLVDLSDTLKEIPSTVCLIGLKDIDLKPWTPEASLYVSTLFKNSTTMIMEYSDNDPFGLNCVTLTTINNNEDVNGCLKELLKSVEQPNISDTNSLNPTVHDLNEFTNLHSNEIIPVRVKNTMNLESQVMLPYVESSLQPGTTVYMTAFIDFDEIYIRKIDDYDDQFEEFIYQVNVHCLTAEPINRPLVIGEIIGAKSTLDDNFYRGRVLKKNDDSTYSVQYIDFGDKDNVSLSNIFELPQDLMISSTVVPITLKGVKSCPINADASNYITNLLSTYEQMIVDFQPTQPPENVILTTVVSKENVNERLNELLKCESSVLLKEVLITENVDIHEKIEALKEKSSKLKIGDTVFITTFVDVHNIFVRKVEDDTDEFSNFIEKVNSFCSSETPIGKLPKLNDIIGAKSITDGCFYRAKVIKKVNDVSYDVQFIDYGFEENVHLTEIVPLSAELKQPISTITLVKLKDVQFSVMNKVVREYVNILSENELLRVDFLDDNTNEVILKTERNDNINDHINKLMNGNKIIDTSVNLKKTEILPKPDFHVAAPLQPGTLVYMTAFVNVNAIYIRKLDDHNDGFDEFLDKVNQYCLAAAPINRPLVVGEIVGAQSTVDDNYYRGKILKQIDHSTYLINFIDFGDIDSVPISKIFELTQEFMIPSTAMEVTLKGLKSCTLNVEASNYITNLLSTYDPMTVDFDPKFPLKDVTLVLVKNNENVAESLNKLLENVDSPDTNIVEDQFKTEEIVPQVIVNDKLPCYKINPLKNGDILYITAYVDAHCIYVRKVDDNNEEFQKLIERVNTYCSLGNTSCSKIPELNQIVGAKCLDDGLFYRAKIVEKVDEKNYNTVFIDFGFEECVNITDIVPLPIQLEQVVPSIHLVGLKDICFDNLNDDGHKYFENLMILGEAIKIEDIDDLGAVTLTVVSLEQNIVHYLNELHADNSISDNTIIDNSLKLDSDLKHIYNDISIPDVPLLINKSTVTIHAFVNLNEIYISVPLNKSELGVFLKKLDAFCVNSKPLNRKPNVGEVFGIRSLTGSSFNRGAVEEKISEDEYKVDYFDLGFKDIVPINNIVEIPEQWKQIPRSIYSVSLKDVHYEILNAQAMSYINKLCENMPLIVEFDENDSDGLNAITLTTVSTKQNVNNHLAKLLNEKEKESSTAVKNLSKGDIVYISSFIDLQTVYVRRIDNETDEFQTFTENFSSSCALISPIAKIPELGEIVAVKEKNGTKFYRAEVIAKLDNERINVCLIDFGSRDIVHISDVVKPLELLIQHCPPKFKIGLDGFNTTFINAIAMQYITALSQTETLIIDSITQHNKVVLLLVKTQCNVNKEIKKLIAKDDLEPKVVYYNGVNTNNEKSVIKYSKPALDTPTQIWIAEKISSSKYSVHTYNSRVEFMRLEKLMFEDSKTFESVKYLKIHMPCIVYFSPSWYRGEILDVIDEVTAKIDILDVGNFSVIRNIKEIFCMPSKYKGKSLLDSYTLVEVIEPSIDQSYIDMDSVGLPSFTSTPIPDGSDQFQFNNSSGQSNLCTTLCHDTITSEAHSPCGKLAQMLKVKDVQYARWLKGSVKTLTFLCMYEDYLVMRDHLIDDALADLETKIQDYCVKITEPYNPANDELCLAKFCDDMWYRAVCIKTADLSKEKNHTVYFLDWGVEYSVSPEDTCEMSKEFIYLPASAHKCYVMGVTASEWNVNTQNAISECILSQVNCQVVERLSNDCYSISCDTIKTLVDTNQSVV